jgi:UDP-N-acetylmuramoyl-tripeptide--D-alanyl-D-alanine ligase
MAVLGEMAELGEEGPALHRATGAEAAARGVSLLVVVGDAARAYLEGAGPDVEGYAVADGGAALELLERIVRPGDAVLVKGSRSAGLEGVAAGLAERLTKRARP